ncbi:MAG: bifunctional 4-hydroxy-2-oxoglutarate aldolase/2-dehydro-3-deoxy-phosphogluconate aldolase [Elainellaceae cyanobacterium]
MSPKSWLSLLEEQRAIAVIRAASYQQGQHMAAAVIKAGMRLIEITWDSDRAADLIAQIGHDYPAAIVGTGTVLDRSMLDGAIAAGVKFVFSPHVNLEMIRVAVEQRVPIIPGALTPSEIVRAWQAGAYSVKVFPISAMGGVSYLKSLRGPLGNIPLIPTGGVTLDNARAFIDWGAIAVGLSSQLFPHRLLAANDWPLITDRAANLMLTLTQQSHPSFNRLPQ